MNPFDFPAVNLASQSPRRAQLLEQMGVPFEVVLPLDIHAAEALEAVLPDELPLDYVLRVGLAKARMMRAQIVANGSEVQRARPILCADTTVAFEQHILGKPESREQAYSMLRLLSGNTHQVHTAVVLAHGDELLHTVVTTDVRFRDLLDADIRAYIDSSEPFGKAGAYAIQGLGACFVAHISGSFSAVKGLPVFEVAQMLTQLAQSNTTKPS